MTNEATVAATVDRPVGSPSIARFVLTTVGFVALGLVALTLFALQGVERRPALAVWGLGLASAGAAAVVGIVVGYIFGIPRTPGANGMDGGGDNQYRANSSIEQISDWVVKILVGLGLTQLSEAPVGIKQLALAFEYALRATPTHTGRTLSGVGAFGASLVLYFAVLGFLAGYVHMRLFLAPAFRMADDRLNERLERAAIDVEHAQRRATAASTRAADFERVTGEMINLLYVPTGFNGAIAVADTYLASHGDPKDAAFWLRYACAWGQRARQFVPGSDDFLAARDKSYAAAEHVVLLQGDTGKQWLRVYLYPAAIGDEAEDDLVAFRNDEKFRALVGGPSEEPKKGDS